MRSSSKKEKLLGLSKELRLTVINQIRFEQVTRRKIVVDVMAKIECDMRTHHTHVQALLAGANQWHGHCTGDCGLNV